MGINEIPLERMEVLEMVRGQEERLKEWIRVLGLGRGVEIWEDGQVAGKLGSAERLKMEARQGHLAKRG